MRLMDETCESAGCTRPVGKAGARGLCHGHYVRRFGPLESASTEPIGKHHRLTEAEKARALEWRRERRSILWIATKLGVARWTIQRLMRKHGLGGYIADPAGGG